MGFLARVVLNLLRSLFLFKRATEKTPIHAPKPMRPARRLMSVCSIRASIVVIDYLLPTTSILSSQVGVQTIMMAMEQRWRDWLLQET